MRIANWDNLRLFLATARAGSTEGAARTLRIDASTVRRRLTALETMTGTAVFERISGELRLTAAGGLLLKAVEEVEHLIESAETGLSMREEAISGLVRIGAPDGTGSFLIAPALAQMQSRLPQIRIELATLPRILDVSRREVDIMILHELPAKGEHKIRKIIDIEIGLYGSSQYLENHGEIRSVQDLRDHSFVFYDEFSDYYQGILRKFLNFGDESWIKFKTTSTVSQACAVSAGAGLALFPDFVAEQWPNLRPVLKGKIFVNSTLWMLTHRDVADRPHVQAAAQAIVSACMQRRVRTS